MSITINDVIPAVRARLGKLVGDKEIEDRDITRECKWILGKMSERISQRALRSFVSQANVAVYATHNRTVRVPLVFPADGIDEEVLNLGSPTIDDEDEATEIYNFPSTWAIKMMRRKRGLPNIRHSFNPLTKQLSISPYPESAGTRYWYISIERNDWTIPNLPFEFEDTLITGTTWRMLEILAMERSEAGGVMREAGRVTYPASELNAIARERKEDFYEDLEIKAKLYSVRR